jgi:RNA polymerase sigma-70 factor (sigma-E family)
MTTMGTVGGARPEAMSAATGDEVQAFTDFETFFASHHVGVVRALTLATGDRHRAEELAQDAFTAALRRWRRVATMDRPATWVYVVALNAERKRWRREERRARAAGPDGTPATASDGAAAVEARMTVAAGLAGLPPRQRAAVVLRHLAGLSLRETAEAMGCAEGTVKSTLHAALAALRVDLTDEQEPHEKQSGQEGRP